jgi:hypothetical protein
VAEKKITVRGKENAIFHWEIRLQKKKTREREKGNESRKDERRGKKGELINKERNKWQRRR